MDTPSAPGTGDATVDIPRLEGEIAALLRRLAHARRASSIQRRAVVGRTPSLRVVERSAPTPTSDSRASRMPASHHQRFVREAIEAYAPDEVAWRLLQTALVAAGVSIVPSSPEALGRFVDHDLARTITNALGYDASAAIRQRLAPLLRSAPTNDERPRHRVGASPTIEFPRVPFGHVILVSADPTLAVRLGRCIDREQTSLVRVEARDDLGRALRVHFPLPRMLLVDAPYAQSFIGCVRRERDLLHRATVVLWAGSQESVRELEALTTSTILRCGSEVELDDVAALVSLGPCE